MSGIFELDEAARILKHRLESREYWCLCVDHSKAYLLEAIERSYYWGNKARHFELMTRYAGCSVFGIAIMKKKEMSAWEYSDILRKVAGLIIAPKALLERDWLACCSPDGIERTTQMITEIIGAMDKKVTQEMKTST